ncbi:hypothetical protein ACHAWF_007415 [Thalassiosira exigua]
MNAIQKSQPAKTTDEHAAFKMAERRDLLILAQQKLDEINRGNLGLSRSGGRPGSASSRGRRQRSAVSSHLLSTLLYMALMSHKLEDMKTMLEEEDGDVYDEWRCLLENLHSPEFHARERIVQNRRAQRTYERKRLYKEEATRLGAELEDTKDRLAALQKLSNETSNELSKTINALREERATLVSRDEERQYHMEELNEKIKDLEKEAATDGAKLHSLQANAKTNAEQLERSSRKIAELEERLSQSKESAAVASERADSTRAALEDTKARLEASERMHVEYREEKDPLISKLRQDLSDLETSRAELSTKVEAANEATSLREIFESRMSELDERIVQTKSMLNEANSDVKTVLSHNDRVDESLALLPDLCGNAALIKDRMDQLHEVAATFSRTSLLEKTSDEIQKELSHVKQKMDDQSEDQRNNMSRELTKVEQRLDELSELRRQNQTMNDLEKKLLQSEQIAELATERADSARTALEETKAQLHASKQSSFAYRSEKDPLISKLQQQLSDSESSVAVLNAKLAAANKALDDTKHNLESSQRSLQANAASFDEMRTQTYALKDQELSKLQEKLDGLSAAQLGELSSVRQKLDGLTELQRQELSNLQQKLEDISNLQQQNNQREIQETNVRLQEKLDGLSTAQLGELSNVQQKLDSLTELQRRELLNLQRKLEDISKLQREGHRRADEDGGDSEPELPNRSHASDGANDARLLRKIAKGVEVVCDGIGRMEDAMYESDCAAEELIEAMCAGLSDASERARAVLSDVEEAMEVGARTTRVRGDNRPLGDVGAKARDVTPPTSASTDASPIADGAVEIVDGFVSEAVSRFDS